MFFPNEKGIKWGKRKKGCSQRPLAHHHHYQLTSSPSVSPPPLPSPYAQWLRRIDNRKGKESPPPSVSFFYIYCIPERASVSQHV